MVRDFLRNLNVLLKSCRLYGIDHVRTVSQLKSAWDHLLAGLNSQGGMQIAIEGSRLMIDGEAIKARPAETSFANLVSGAGISSIEFTSQARQEEFERFVRAFAESGPNFEGLSSLLRVALGTAAARGIRVNEFRVVASDGASGTNTMLGQAAAENMVRALSAEQEGLKDVLADPRKLLALVAAAEIASASQENAAGAAPGIGAESADLHDGDARQEMAAFRMLSNLGRDTGKGFDEQSIREQVVALPAEGREGLQQALGKLAAELPSGGQDPELLLKLAEHLALRIAMKRFECGDYPWSTAQDSLSRMSREILGLRQKMAASQIPGVQAQTDTELHEGLSAQFWAALPAAAKLKLLLSPQVYDVPIQRIRNFLEQVPWQGGIHTPQNVLEHFAQGVSEDNPERRLRAIHGVVDLADLFAGAGDEALENVIARIGAQLQVEADVELQNALGSALVELSQLAADGRHNGALKQTIVQLKALAQVRAEVADALRPRIGVENRVPQMVEEALKKPQVPPRLLEVLKELPRAAALQTANQFNRATEKDRSDRVFALAALLGPGTAEVLRETLRSGPDSEALVTIGLLTRLEITSVGEILNARLPRWNHSYQNLVVRQIASCGAAGRGELLAQLIDRFDSLDVVAAIDEIGMCGDLKAAPRLLRIAGGELPAGRPVYLRIKAIEALGRLRVKEAVPILRKLVEEKKLWIWTQPRELRIVALQALLKIEPEWAQPFAQASGLTKEELSLSPREPTADWAGVRQRCYERIKPRRTLRARLVTSQREFVVTIVDMSLGGAFAMCEDSVTPGTRAEFVVKSGSTEIRAVVLIRGMRKSRVNFEIVDIDFEERSKLRRMLIDIQKEPG